MAGHRILVAAIFAVQMAVDGDALKATIDTWTNATQSGDKASAYQVAEGMRALEKGLSGFFHLVNGTTLLVLGLAIAFGRCYPRWLGWVGAVSGLGFLAGGIVAAHTGFSPLVGTVPRPNGPRCDLPDRCSGVHVAQERTAR